MELFHGVLWWSVVKSEQLQRLSSHIVVHACSQHGNTVRENKQLISDFWLWKQIFIIGKYPTNWEVWNITEVQDILLPKIYHIPYFYNDVWCIFRKIKVVVYIMNNGISGQSEGRYGQLLKWNRKRRIMYCVKIRFIHFYLLLKVEIVLQFVSSEVDVPPPNHGICTIDSFTMICGSVTWWYINCSLSSMMRVGTIRR